MCNEAEWVEPDLCGELIDNNAQHSRRLLVAFRVGQTGQVICFAGGYCCGWQIGS